MTVIKTMLIGSLTIALAVACSSKAKPKKTTPDPIVSETEAPSADSDEKTTDLDSAPLETDDEAAETAANLSEVIYFAYDSSELAPDARDSLNENAEWLNADTARSLLIEGHTDETGTSEYNLGLGERRAWSAKNYLVRLGIKGTRIRIITYGEERPASEEDSQNRRSVFVATRK